LDKFLESIFSAEIFGRPQKAFEVKPRRENKYFEGGPNISMIFVPGGPNISIFLDRGE